jgi:oligopeptidase A
MAASTMMRQLGFGALDMYLHHHYNPYQTNESIFEVQNRILKE